MPNVPEHIYVKRLLRSGLPHAQVKKRLEDFESYNASSKTALRDVTSFVEAFPSLLVPEDLSEDFSPNIGRGIAIVGDPGAGKTTLGCMVASEIHRRYEKRVMFKAFADYIAMLQEQMSLQKKFDEGDEAASERWWQIYHTKAAMFNVPFLFVDDVGKEYRTASGFAETEWDRLLRWRFRNATPTGISTNIPLEKWGRIYGLSMQSFAREAFHFIPMGGKDFRSGGSAAQVRVNSDGGGRKNE